VRPSAEPVLLLHGQPGSAADWEQVQAHIGERAETIALERPGWKPRTRPRDLAGNATVALGALDAAGVMRATVVGHSLGGAVAAWLAAEHPERVTALVLLAPSANVASLNRLDQLLAAPLLGPLMTASGLAGIGMTLVAPPTRRRVSVEFGLEDRYLRRYARALLQPATWGAFAIEQRRLLHDLPALERRLAAISAPTTVVIGTADRIVTPASARQLAARIPDARLVPLQGATHLLLQQNAAEVAEIIVAAAGRR
jgi:pimeloyl-ACP methyl ester carboxylesterase